LKQKGWGTDLASISRTAHNKSIFFYHWPLDQSGVPQVTVIVTEEMRKLYREYGYVIKLDYIYGLVKDKAKEQKIVPTIN
jgi:hypothetical protein